MRTSRTFGPFEFNAAAVRLERDGAVIALEPKALDVLWLLIDRAPAVVEKAELFAVVWKDVAVTDNALTRVIAQLRRALDDDARNPRYIETVATRGYRLIAPVREAAVAGSPSAPARATSDVGADEVPDVAAGAVIGARRNHRLALGGAALTAALLIAAALLQTPWRATAGLLGATDDALAPGVDFRAHAMLRPAQFTTGRGMDAGLAFAKDGTAVAFSSDRSGAFEIYVQSLTAGASPTRLTVSRGQNVQPAWSPDGRFVAYHDGAGGGVWIVPSRGGTARRLVPTGSRPVWSPDGRRIAFQTQDGLDLSLITAPVANSTVSIVDVQTGVVRPVTRAGRPSGAHIAPRWSGDGRTLLFAETPSPLAQGAAAWTVALWRVAPDGSGLHRVAQGDRFMADYDEEPGGRGAWVSARAVPALWWLPFTAAGDAQAQPTGLTAVGRPVQPVVSADGGTLAWTAVNAHSGLWAVPLTGSAGVVGTAAPLALGAGVRATGAASAPDGRLAYSGVVQGQAAHVWIRDRDGADRQVTIDGGDHHTPFWLGRDEVATFSRHRDVSAVSVIDVATGNERELFRVDGLPVPPGTRPHPVEGLNVALSPSQTQVLVTRLLDGVANLWSVRLRDGRPAREATQLTAEAGGASFPHWSPDGRWIAYQCEAGDQTHVCVVDADGGSRTQLTHGRGVHFVGGWIGDHTILIAARRNAVWNVLALNRLDGEERALTAFTDARSYVRYPQWDPAGQRVIFERAESTGNIWMVDLPGRTVSPGASQSQAAGSWTGETSSRSTRVPSMSSTSNR